MITVMTAMTTVAWVLQEKVFVIFNSTLAEAHETGALKIISKSMFAKVFKFYRKRVNSRTPSTSWKTNSDLFGDRIKRISTLLNTEIVGKILIDSFNLFHSLVQFWK